MKRFAAIAALVITSAACSSYGEAPADVSSASSKPKKPKKPGGTIGSSTESTQSDEDATLPVGCAKMDILFVIDDSASMFEEQQGLTNAFPSFIKEIADTNAGQLDYRVAITTTSSSITVDDHPDFSGPGDSIAANGSLVELNTCGMTRPWIERSDDNVADTFSCAAKVGLLGSIIEMPLTTMRMALQQNAAFVRDDALLAVIFLTDEDDGSSKLMHYTTSAEQFTDVADVSDFAKFLDDLKGHRDRWATSVIAAPTACKSAFGDAFAAPRLQQFAGLAGKHGAMSSICDGDLNVSLKSVLSTFQTACKDFPPVVK